MSSDKSDADETREAYVRNIAEELYMRTVFSSSVNTAGTSYQNHARSCFAAAEGFAQVEEVISP